MLHDVPGTIGGSYSLEPFRVVAALRPPAAPLRPRAAPCGPLRPCVVAAKAPHWSEGCSGATNAAATARGRSTEQSRRGGRPFAKVRWQDSWSSEGLYNLYNHVSKSICMCIYIYIQGRLTTKNYYSQLFVLQPKAVHVIRDLCSSLPHCRHQA